ncbi:hypothetical protein L915_16995 [Phytophthora nicotianae]|uniref:DUF7869 domain-containing protein n=1 Tax=Phytophthora nicotianae TaxID=4792 RepID=W2G0R1_PHYNI|nr:hypothetical protein L915_16995 [Phytophthora nicotianae]
MNAYVLENDLDVRNPRPSTFRKLLQQYCPTIRIRSPRSNVCDLCAILHTCMRSCVTAELTEELGVHTEATKEMSLEYKKDLASVSEDHAVIVMDFSQNLTLPSVAIQLLESVAGKGTDEVNSMLYHFIQRIVLANDHRKLSIYADNCCGQNKNNFVIKMLLASAQTGELDVVELKFFVKGHTKNAVDRGFNLMRKKIAKEDVWTADQLLEVINDSLSSSALVHIPKENTTMKLFRTPVTEVYKDLKGVQRYQIFTMCEKKPGVVSCRTNAAKVRRLLAAYLEPLQPPSPNFERKSSKCTTSPTDEEERHAKEAKQARRSASAKNKKRHAAVCDEAKVAPVDCEEENENRANVSKATSAQPKTGTRSRKRAKKDN